MFERNFCHQTFSFENNIVYSKLDHVISISICYNNILSNSSFSQSLLRTLDMMSDLCGLPRMEYA